MVKEEYVHAVPLTGRQFEWIKGHVEYVAQYGQSRKVAAEIIRNITMLELREVEK